MKYYWWVLAVANVGTVIMNVAAGELERAILYSVLANVCLFLGARADAVEKEKRMDAGPSDEP